VRQNQLETMGDDPWVHVVPPLHVDWVIAGTARDALNRRSILALLW
jgi:hypothetical protein